MRPKHLKPWLTSGLILGGLLFLIWGGYAWWRESKQPPAYEITGNTTLVQTPRVSAVATSAADLVLTDLPVSALLPGASWVPQTFNNCGPATVSMVLQYFGYQVSQETTKGFLRTNSDDKNVFAHEIKQYLESEFNIQSKVLVNGNLETLKRLIANGYYVMAESWLHPNEDIGHVTVIRGYDDSQGVLVADDSYLGAGITYSYAEFDAGQWKPFNREYFPVYLPQQEAQVRTIVGEDWDRPTMLANSVAQAQREIAVDPNNVYSYFNLGTSLYALERYEEAALAFQQARQIGWPRRMLWYQIEPVQTLNELGRYQEAITLAREALAGNETFAEMHFELARSYLGLGDKQKARTEAEATLRFAPDFKPAHDFLRNL